MFDLELGKDFLNMMINIMCQPGGMLLNEITIEIDELPVKQFSLQEVGGPYPISWRPE